MIEASQWVGIAILIFFAIFGFLFVNPKSPVKRRWWSASNKLGITFDCDPDIIIENYSDTLSFRVGFIAIPSIRVERIRLKIGHTKVWASNWIPTGIKATEARYLNFPRPTELSKGYYDVTLFAYTPEGVSKSDKISISLC